MRATYNHSIKFKPILLIKRFRIYNIYLQDKIYSNYSLTSYTKYLIAQIHIIYLSAYDFIKSKHTTYLLQLIPTK